MITYEMIHNAHESIANDWGEAGQRVIEAAHRAEPFNGNMKAFLNNCVCCGGDWGGMLLSGVRKLWPEVWDAIPNHMGVYAFTNICYVLILCGVDTSE